MAMDERSMRSFNLVFRFVLELLALLALFLWGTSLSDDLAVQVILGLGAPLLVVIVWALFVAPKASRRLPDPLRLVVELVIFVLATVAFGLAIGPIVAIMFGLAVVISLALMFLWGQRGY
jgi:hypothetical protein